MIKQTFDFLFTKAQPLNHLHGSLCRAGRMRISNAQGTIIFHLVNELCPDPARGSVPTRSSFDRFSCGDEHALTSLTMLHHIHHHPSIFFPPNQGMDKLSSVHKQIEDLHDQAERLMVQSPFENRKPSCRTMSDCPSDKSVDKTNLKLAQTKGIVTWSEVLLHLQPEPTSTSQSLQTENDEGSSREPVITTNWIFNKIEDHNLSDLPGLRSHPILAADLLSVVVRCKILCNLFPTDSHRQPDRVFEIMDLFD
ncbi:hypothetical protein MJO28_009550 [Puccinia striiformis f. sp. tritici]|uniref:Uncharacterized protein n=1 Tax=Puccinia striiformis f. sp. tritici TaxID=168172 RepID=A0ACC0E8Q3_9BASI|nr:hypothetical protein MJO28_009550 [Puccinia striiformis f. sp. tritici]KAI7950659.1 hypothetical protein MJO29_009333 [Puccinia striiformis f. sp. tritici]